MASDAVTLALPAPGGGERAVRLSSPDRPVWPDGGDGTPITKRELADYAVAVAQPWLAAVGGRPVTLQRFRGGITGEGFYSKSPPRGAPAWIRTVEVTYPSGRHHPQVVFDEVAALVWAVQMGTVTVHPWPVRASAPDLVDQIRLDLDPQPGRSFADVATVAVAARELLAELGLTAWVKTSGGRGVHVEAPVAATHEFLDVRHAVIGIARELERRLPDLVTTSWWKEDRGERVFIDFNQACRDRTLAGAYSPRAHPHAPVSFPVPWEELHGLDSRAFTVRTVPALLRERGDAWARRADARPGRIDAALGLWTADVERGLGELPFPPDHPKMPGEPPRVQPSRARTR